MDQGMDQCPLHFSALRMFSFLCCVSSLSPGSLCAPVVDTLALEEPDDTFGYRPEYFPTFERLLFCRRMSGTSSSAFRSLNLDEGGAAAAVVVGRVRILFLRWSCES